MSITQTYRIAHTARGKLSSEAARGDHDLRLLVGHANLLDSLMVELQDAEREQERWFNSTVAASKTSEQQQSEQQPRRVKFFDDVVRDIEEEDEDTDSESDEDEQEEEEEEHLPHIILSASRRLKSPEPVVSPIDEDDDDDDDEEEDDDADNEELSLVRTHSRYEEVEIDEELPHSPPELVHDSDESDDEMPPSPPQPTLAFDSVVVERDFALSRKQKPLVEDGDLLLEETIFGNHQVQLIAAQA